MATLFSSTDALIDSVYPVVIVELAPASSQQAAATAAASPVVQQHPDSVLETNVANTYRLRFYDRLSSGLGEPGDAAVQLEKLSHSTPGKDCIVLFSWPIEYIRRYGCETKNIFILELGRRCVGYPNTLLRFDTRPSKASSLEADFAALVKKVLKFMDPAAKALAKKPNGAMAFLKKNKSPVVTNAACEYAELAPYKPRTGASDHMQAESAPSTQYARVVIKH